MGIKRLSKSNINKSIYLNYPCTIWSIYFFHFQYMKTVLIYVPLVVSVQIAEVSKIAFLL